MVLFRLKFNFRSTGDLNPSSCRLQSDERFSTPTVHQKVNLSGDTKQYGTYNDSLFIYAKQETGTRIENNCIQYTLSDRRPHS